MAFTIDASALHRPLGFGLDDALRITVERHAPGQAGAAAAAILPPKQLADAERQALRAELAARGGFLHGVARPAAASGPLVVASARGIVDGHGVSVLGLAAGRPLPPDRDALKLLLLTDAALAPPTIEALLHEVMSRSFASLAGIATPRPADAVVALANGVASAAPLEPGLIGLRTLLVGCVAVAQMLVRRLLEESFAPASARVVQITTSGAADEAQATRVTEALAADAGTRAAMAASGPDRASCAPLIERLGARAGELRVAWGTRAAAPPAAPAHGTHGAHGAHARHTAQAALRIDLGVGAAMATRWTAVASAEPG